MIGSKQGMSKAAMCRKAIADMPEQGQFLAVREEGNMVVPEDRLSQRLSKVQKAEPSDAEKTVIARKIFESVDRKSAEPQTREKSKKGVNRSKHLHSDDLVLTPEESQIIKSPIEILLVHTSDGRLKSVTQGGAHDVTIPNDVPEGAILSHNHPSGRGPSDADLKSVLTFPGVTLRVVARNEIGKSEIFAMNFGGKLKKSEIHRYSELYFEQCDDGGDTHTARRESLALISQIIGDRLRTVSRIIQ